MKVGHMNVTRPDYFDRTPTTLGRSFVALNKAPHAITAQFGYVVPTFRKFYIEAAVAHVIRIGVAAAAGLPEAFITVAPSSGATMRFAIGRIGTNAVGDHSEMVTSGLGLMSAGNTIEGLTGDNSTGGSLDYILSLKGTEFNE